MTDNATSTRGPYRKRPRLKVKDEQWFAGDVVIIDGQRWLIRWISRDGAVELHRANTQNAVHWTTTLDALPKKVSRR